MMLMSMIVVDDTANYNSELGIIAVQVEAEKQTNSQKLSKGSPSV